ncbi:hypothetical protein ACFQX7_29855 [Luedemannella flava]
MGAWRQARAALAEADGSPGLTGLGSALDAYLVNVTVVEPDQLHLMDEVTQQATNGSPPTVGDRALDCVLALRAAFEARPEAAALAVRGLSDGLLVRQGTGDSPLVCGWLALLAAENERAAASIDHARREVYRQGSVRAYGPVHAFAALDELWRGNLADAEREARSAVEAVERSGVRLGRPFVGPFLADILAERGDLPGARAALAWAGLPEERRAAAPCTSTPTPVPGCSVGRWAASARWRRRSTPAGFSAGSAGTTPRSCRGVRRPRGRCGSSAVSTRRPSWRWRRWTWPAVGVRPDPSAGRCGWRASSSVHMTGSSS